MSKGNDRAGGACRGRAAAARDVSRPNRVLSRRGSVFESGLARLARGSR